MPVERTIATGIPGLGGVAAIVGAALRPAAERKARKEAAQERREEAERMAEQIARQWSARLAVPRSADAPYGRPPSVAFGGTPQWNLRTPEGEVIRPGTEAAGFGALVSRLTSAILSGASGGYSWVAANPPAARQQTYAETGRLSPLQTETTRETPTPAPPLGALPATTYRIGSYAGPVMRATQPGAPPGTGSGVTPQQPPRPEEAFLYSMVAILDLLRRLGIRLPWDPRVARGGVGTVPTFPSVTFDWSGAMANIWGSILQGAGQLLGGVLSSGGGMYGGGYGTPGIIPYTPPVAMPGGAPAGGFAGGILSGLQALAPGGGDLSSPWAMGMRGAVPRLHVVPNPTTGRMTWFRPAGRPVLFSGDLAACRRVRKVAGRARRRLGGR